MNALEAASLVMIPSGYENGTLGSLKPTDGTGDFTFSRGSDISATRVNEQGYIEKGYENLLLQSNSFDTTWTTQSASVTSGQAGYDGTNDAWILDKSAFAGQVKQSISVSGVNTLSVYLKAGTLNFVRIITSTGVVSVTIDLSNGVFAAVSGGIISKNIESSGNGFYKVSISFVESIGLIGFIPQESLSVLGVSGSIYIQDAMLNQGMVSYPYVETTTAPVAGGILEDMPRLDYTDSSCPSLKLEPQRTNLIEYSEYLGSNWTFIRTNYESNTATSPEGLTNAAKVFANTSSGNHYFERVGFTGFTSGDYTYSFFAKSAGSDFVQIATSTGFDSRYQNFNLTTGEKASGDTDSSGYDTSITPIGDDGWYRLTITANAPSTSVRFLIIPILTDAARNPVFTGDGVNGFYFYGAQLEQDATYPTSYIPTNGTSQTRLADFFDSSADFTNFFEYNQGTIYIETDKRLFENTLGNESFIGFKDGSKFWRIIGSQNLIFTQSVNWGDTLAIYPAATNPTKYLFKWDGSNTSFYVDGTLIASAPQTAPFNPNEFGRSGIGVDMNSQELLNQFTLFPTALSDDECIELTTI